MHHAIGAMQLSQLRPIIILYALQLHVVAGNRKDIFDQERHVDIWKEAHMYPMAEFLREKMSIWFVLYMYKGEIMMKTRERYYR